MKHSLHVFLRLSYVRVVFLLLSCIHLGIFVGNQHSSLMMILTSYYYTEWERDHIYFQCRYSVMLSCWMPEGSKRPKFSNLVMIVNDLLEKDAGYLELSLCPTKTASPPHSPASPAEIEMTELASFEPQRGE